MKKFILLALILWVNAGMAQSFNCRLDGQNFSLQLVTDQVFVKFTQPLKNADIQALFGSGVMNLDPSDGTASNTKFIRLNSGIGLDQIQALITTMNRNENVVLASPLLQYNGIKVGMTDKLIAKLSGGIDASVLDDFCRTNSLTNNGALAMMDGYYSLSLSKDRIFDQLTIASQLFDAGIVDFAEPNFVRFLNVSSFNDPMYSSQHALSNINATGAWGQMGTSAGGVNTIKIAVLDCGVQSNHPDLFGNCVLGCDATYSSGSQNVQNTFGDPINNDALNFHGTACAGVIAAKANNGIGIVGLAYNCQVVPVRIGEVVINNSNDTIMLTDDNTIAYAFSYAALHADVISCAWGGGLPSGTVTNAIHSAVTTGRGGNGCPTFFSSGNKGTTIIPYPGYLQDVICVGSTNASDHKSSFSNYSVYLDIAAPGENIVTTDLTGTNGADPSDYVTTNGTSFSCPYAAGLMGLMLSMNPALTQTTARNIIESTCDKTGSYTYTNNSFYPNGTWSNELGYGRINANAAIQQTISSITSTGPFNAVASTVTPNCYNGSVASAYFNLQISGGTPYLNNWNSTNNTGFKYYLVDYFSDAAHTVPSVYRAYTDTYFTQSTVPSVPLSLIKKIYLDLSTVTSFPFTTTIYLDIYSPVSTVLVHHYTSVTVTVNHAPDFTLTSPINLCLNQNLYLGSYVTNGTYTTPGNVSTWGLGNYPNTNSIVYSVPNPVIHNLTYSDAVSLTITSSNGCAATKTANVNVSNIQVNPAISTLQTCITSGLVSIGPGSITGAATGTLIYQWYPATGLSATNVKNPQITASVLGAGLKNYTLTITDVNGCSQNFVYPVNVNTVQSTVNITSDLSLNPCPGHDIQLTATLTGPYSIYSNESFTTGSASWPAVMSSPTVGQVTVHPYANTTYYFNAMDPNGCVASGSITIPVKTKYSFSANAGADVAGCSPVLRTITGSGSAGAPPYTYEWLPNHVTSQTLSVPDVSATYTLEVKDANGCRAQDQTVVTASPTLYTAALAFTSTNPAYADYFHIGGPAGTVFSPANMAYTTASGGTPPYTYSWSPSQYFTNPTVYNPTTVPMYESTQIICTTTDAKGCIANTAFSPSSSPLPFSYIIIGGEKKPLEIYPEYDVCGSAQKITINKDITEGGLNYFDGQYSNFVLTMYNIVTANSIPRCNTNNEMEFLIAPDYRCLTPPQTTFSFTPAPTYQLGREFTFAPGVTSVNIQANQSINTPNGSTNIIIPKQYNYTYNFPQKDNSRNNMLLMSNTLVYVGIDQILHSLSWEYSIAEWSITPSWHWQHRRVIPVGGWGNVRVEGWLATDNNSLIYFKGTDQKMYVIMDPFTTYASVVQLPSPVNVKSDIAFRQDGLYFVGADNLIHRFNASNVYDYSFIPSGGWGTVTVKGHMALAAYPSTNIAFVCADNKVRYLRQVSSSWNLSLLSPVNLSAGETMIDQQTGRMYFKDANNRIETWDWNGSLNQYVFNETIYSTNDPGYSVDGYLIKDPYGDRIFYKGNDGAIYNIYKTGSTWTNYPLSYMTPNTAGDLRLAPDGRIFYISKDKWLHEYDWSPSTNWTDQAVSVLVPKNVKACSFNFKMMKAGDPDSENPEDATSLANTTDKLTVYPNPNEGKFTVDLGDTKKSNVTVYDLMGKPVAQFSNVNSNTLEIDLSAFSKGIYTVKSVDENEVRTARIIIR